MEDKPIKLAELVDAMRRELNIARKQGEGNDFRFTVEEIELEVQFTVEKEFSGEVGATIPILKVIGAKGGGKYNKETIQRAKLVLKLKEPDKVLLSGEQSAESNDTAEPDEPSGKTDLVGTLDPSET